MLGQGEGIDRRPWASGGGSGRELGPKTVPFKPVLVGTSVLGLGSRTPWNGLTFHGPISLSSGFSRLPEEAARAGRCRPAGLVRVSSGPAVSSVFSLRPPHSLSLRRRVWLVSRIACAASRPAVLPVVRLGE